MALPTGIGGQFGCVAETTYGTYVAPTRFLEIHKENIKADVAQVQSFGLGRGRFLRTSRNKSYIKGAGGSIELPVMSKGFGLIFKHMLGSLSVAQQGGTSEYLHTATVDAVGLVGLFMTVQIGRPDVGATVRPFNYEGSKITGWELKCDLDSQLLLTLDFDSETEQTSDALAVASYSSGDEALYFTGASVTIGGSTVFVRSLSIKSDAGLDNDRRGLGNVKKEPLPNAEAGITAALDFEFESLTRHGQLTAGTEISNLIATFDTGTAIPSGNGSNYKLVATAPKLIYTAGGPNIGGPDVLREQMEAKVLYDGSNSPIKLEYYTTDTAA
jgi:hypothetical protein